MRGAPAAIFATGMSRSSERFAVSQSKHNRLIVNIVVALRNVIEGVDVINELADEKVLGDNIQGSLADINYRVVGHVDGNSNQCSGLVILEVNADVSDVIEENLEAEASAREEIEVESKQQA